MKPLTTELCRIKHPFKGKTSMNQIYLTSQGQDRQEQLKLRIPILLVPLEINRSPTNRSGQCSLSHQHPRPEAEIVFSHRALPFSSSHFPERYIHTKYVICIEISIYIFIAWIYTLHNCISKCSVNGDGGRN